MADGSVTKGQRTRLRIIEEATLLFAQKGLSQVSFAEIGERAGVSQPAIYRHFKNQDELVLQSCLYWAARGQEFIDKTSDTSASADHQLKIYIERNLIHSSRSRPQFGLLIGLYYLSISSPEMLSAYKEIKNGGIRRIQTYILLGNRDGSWSCPEPYEAAYFIHSLLVGEIMKLIIEPREERIAVRKKRVCDHALSFLLNRHLSKV